MQPCSRYPTLTRAAGKAIQVTAEIEAGLQAPTLQRDLPHECRQKRAGPQNSAQRTHLVVHGLELGGIGVGLQQLRVKQLLLLHGIQLTLHKQSWWPTYSVSTYSCGRVESSLESEKRIKAAFQVECQGIIQFDN